MVVGDAVGKQGTFGCGFNVHGRSLQFTVIVACFYQPDLLQVLLRYK